MFALSLFGSAFCCYPAPPGNGTVAAWNPDTAYVGLETRTKPGGGGVHLIDTI